jgi:hypothetical protein
MAIIPADERVFMVGTSTNTTYGGSAALKAMQQWYTMQDVSDSVQPYKVFTALLTQSGGSGPNQNSEFPLEVGVSYTIFSGGAYILGDFTNVGAPNNEIGTIFIATGTTPNSWGSNISLSWDTGAPVATVLENTIGNVWFTYDGSGVYTVNSSELFSINKSWLVAGSLAECCSNDWLGKIIFNQISDSLCRLYTLDSSDVLIDTQLWQTPIEIRVYN